MTTADPDRLLAMLRDPNVETQEIAAVAGAPREEVARAARLLHGLARARPEEIATLPAPLAAAFVRVALAGARTDLLAALAAHPSKEIAKDSKRALHVLRTRGVAVPEPARPPPPAPAATAEPPLPAYATVVDGHGERAIWLPRNLPGKGIEIAQAVVSDERGLIELQVGLLGRKEWRAFVKGLLERGAAMGVGEIDRAEAHAVVAAARARNERSGQRVPDGADLWLQPLGPAAAPPEPTDRPALPEEEERAALAASGALHELPLLRGWLADEELLRRTAARLDEIAVSPLYLDDRQRADQQARTLADALETWLVPPRRALLAARLRAVADHLEGRGDGASARSAAAVARALAAGVPGREIPFARLLVEKAFPPGPAAAAAAEGTPGAGAPLIIAPR